MGSIPRGWSVTMLLLLTKVVEVSTSLGLGVQAVLGELLVIIHIKLSVPWNIIKQSVWQIMLCMFYFFD